MAGDKKILKIFKSLDLRNNKIYNLKVPTPTLPEHAANKDYIDATTLYDTQKAQTYQNPFKFNWITNVLNKNYKQIFDDLFFPNIPYAYTNPVLNKITFKPESPALIIPTFEGNKYLCYYNSGFNLIVNFDVTNGGDRPLSQSGKIRYNSATGTVIGSAGDLLDLSTLKVSNLVLKPTDNLFFEKIWLACPPKNGTYNTPTTSPGFTDVPFTLSLNVTNYLKQNILFLPSMLTRLKTGTDQIATDITPSAPFPSTLQYSNAITFGQNVEGLMDIMLPDIDWKKHIVVMYHKTSDGIIINKKVIPISYFNIGANPTTFNNGEKYYLGYINLGYFDFASTVVFEIVPEYHN